MGVDVPQLRLSFLNIYNNEIRSLEERVSLKGKVSASLYCNEWLKRRYWNVLELIEGPKQDCYGSSGYTIEVCWGFKIYFYYADYVLSIKVVEIWCGWCDYVPGSAWGKTVRSDLYLYFRGLQFCYSLTCRVLKGRCNERNIPFICILPTPFILCRIPPPLWLTTKKERK